MAPSSPSSTLPTSVSTMSGSHRIGRHFDRYVEDRRLPGFLVVVTRGQGRLRDQRGFRDLESAAPVEADTRFRIYSMTKPITSVAAMICYEAGPDRARRSIEQVHPGIRRHEGLRRRLVAPAGQTVAALEPIRIWHLMTHTAGLTYGWMCDDTPSTPSTARPDSSGARRQTDLAGCCDDWRGRRCVCQPGTEWNYSVATDVLGRVVEVVSGLPLDQFLAERVLGPLEMNETSFPRRRRGSGKLAALYSPGPHHRQGRHGAHRGRSRRSRPPTALSGGGGLVSTAADYHRFTQMLLRRGELDGVRILGSRTSVHDPQPSARRRRHGPIRQPDRRPARAWTRLRARILGRDRPGCAESHFERGEYGWGGAASTAFWVDPAEELTVLFFTQLWPSTTYPVRRELKQLVYSAIVD